MAKPEQSPSEEARAVEETLRDPATGASSRPASRSGGSKRGSRGARQRGSERGASTRGAQRRSGQRQTRRHRVGGRRHPDIEVARLLVKRGYVDKPAAVEALKLQKRRAKQGKKRIPFLQLLVKQRHVEAQRLPAIQDEIRRNTYLCDNCDARAVILAGSQSRRGNCPRCGAPIWVEEASDLPRVSDFVREEHEPESEGRMSGTLTWRPMGNRAMRALEPGQVVFDRYQLAEELGRGAMGIVYRARHLELGKDVALKILVPNEEDWEQQVARFRREAAAVQKLRHPGIVAVQDFGSDGELYYLTMDLVEGGESLHRTLKRKADPPSLERRLEILEQVARAVGHAHERGVVHRDLKPANVLLDPNGRPLVADFGLAKDEDAEGAELTRTQDRLGTPLFMAPEQIKLGAAGVDGRADVWALGVMLFVCVTGRYPFRSRTVLDLYTRILHEEPDWDGTRYSAPDRRAPLHDSSSLNSQKLQSTAAAGGASAEATEVGSRTPSGKLPRTLPEPALALEAAPPPFAPPPELAGARLAAKVPADLRAILRAALAKDPADRYPSAEAFADDLERFLAGQRVVGGGPSALKRLRLALRRRRVLAPLAALLAGLAAVCAVGGGYAFVSWREAEERRAREARERREAEELRAAQAALDQRADAAWQRASAKNTPEAYAKAKQDLDQLLSEHPRLARALQRRGELQLQLLQPAEARRDLAAAAAAAAQRGPVMRLEIRAAEARAALMAGDPAAAVAVAGAALEAIEQAGSEAGPSLRDALLLHLALAAAIQGERDLATRVESRIALRREQGSPGPLAPALAAAQARLALVREDPAGARSYLEGVDLSDSFEATLADAHVRVAAGEGDPEAFERADRLFRSKPREEVRLLNALADDLRRARRYDELLRVNRMTSRLVPFYGRLYWYIGNTQLNRRGQLEQALPNFRAAVRHDPYDLQARDFYLACLLVRSDQRAALDEALARFELEAARLEPDSPRPWIRKAYLLLRRGELSAAWEALAQAAAKPAGAALVGAARAAVLRLASKADLAALRERGGESAARSPEELEASYVLPEGLGKPEVYPYCDDWLELARVYLEAGRLPHARRALARVPLPRRVKSGDADHRRRGLRAAQLWVLQARLDLREGEVERALELLREARAHYTKAPEAFPQHLRAFPELAEASDPRVRELLE